MQVTTKKKKFIEAVQQVSTLDYAHSFNVSHRKALEFSQRLCALLPGRNFTDVFFTMCGSTAVDTLAMQFHRAR